MSKALEIAAERYAKGEITKEEFEDIRSALGAASSNTEAPPPPPREATSSATPQPTLKEYLSDPASTSATPTGTYFDNPMVIKALRYLLTACAIISGLQAFLIIKASGLQKKYEMAYALENEPLFLTIVGIPFLITIILFLFWKKKSTDNLVLLRGPQTITPAGAVYWYFVPIAWFWKPYEAMRNLAVGFNMSPEDQKGLPIWWAVWWGSLGIAIIAALALPEVVRTEQQASAFVWWAVAIYVVDAFSFIVTRELVTKVAEVENVAIAGSNV